MGNSHNGFFKGLTFCSSLLIVSSKDIIASHSASSHKINDIPQVSIASFRYSAYAFKLAGLMY